MGPLRVDLRVMEGHQVSLALRDGSRLDDCLLVSAPRGALTSVWLFVNGGDAFVPVDEIGDAWEPRVR